jgi:ATP-binding cassette subfamily B protein/subfamily B ATP-binding cassette protein MsbA
MQNFLRCLRVCWPYRWRLTLSILCAVLAALFWSLNFLAIHPALKILGGTKSLTQSVQADIDEVERVSRAPALEKIERLRVESEQVGPEKQLELAASIDQAQLKVQRADVSIWWMNKLKRFYSVLPDNRFPALVWLMAAVVVSTLVRGLLEAGQESFVGSVTNLTIYNLRNRFFRSALRLDVNQFANHGAYDLTARYTNDTEVLGAGLKALFGKVVSEPLRVVACVTCACFFSWRLTLLFLVLVPLGGYVVGRVGRMMKRASKRLMERMSDIHKILNESFNGIRVVKAFTMEPYERRRCRGAAREFYRRAMRVVNVDAIAGPVIEVMGVTGVVFALIAGAYLVLNQRTTILGIKLASSPLDHETLLTYYALLAAIADPLRKLSSVYTKLHAAAAAADRLMEQIDRRPAVTRNGLGPTLWAHEKSIEFRDVSFGYDSSRLVLDDINLKFDFGQTIAVVGRNGCGKSTLLGLLPRFFDPDHGSVLIDGTDIRGVNLRSLRRQIALVTQDTILFDDTIAANIGYGRRNASRLEIEAAARKAYAHEFIERLPAGYETRVGELGRMLSGGEKQRIALARAILRDPRLLVLDEFTSQVDAESEAKIHRALRDFMKGRTTFLITHRLHTLESADAIVVLERGRVEAVGRHHDLILQSPAYQSLHEANVVKRAA